MHNCFHSNEIKVRNEDKNWSSWMYVWNVKGIQSKLFIYYIFYLTHSYLHYTHFLNVLFFFFLFIDRENGLDMNSSNHLISWILNRSITWSVQFSKSMWEDKSHFLVSECSAKNDGLPSWQPGLLPCCPQINPWVYCSFQACGLSISIFTGALLGPKKRGKNKIK